jgi:hypothetical protein
MDFGRSNVRDAVTRPYGAKLRGDIKGFDSYETSTNCAASPYPRPLWRSAWNTNRAPTPRPIRIVESATSACWESYRDQSPALKNAPQIMFWAYCRPPGKLSTWAVSRHSGQVPRSANVREDRFRPLYLSFSVLRDAGPQGTPDHRSRMLRLPKVFLAARPEHVPGAHQDDLKQPSYLWSRHLQMTVCRRFL